MNAPQEISYKLVIEKIEKFKKNYGDEEEALTMLFKDYPDNSDIKQVTVKVAVLDKLYSTRIRFADFSFIVKNIVEKSKEITDMLQYDERNYNLYKLIAFNNYTFINDDKKEENVHNAYSFATKYLSFSKSDNPELYPIMDSYSKELLNKYCEQYKGRLTKLSYNTYDYKKFCKTFDEFKALVNEIVKKDTEHIFTAKEIDMFLWQYAKELKKSSKND